MKSALAVLSQRSSTKHRLFAAIVAAGLLGTASCAQKAVTAADAKPSEPRFQVGSETSGFPGATKPFEVPLDDSLASLRQKPAGTPGFGEAAYITHLPTPSTRQAPDYPAIARKAGVSGTVLVHTLVLADGTVGATWIIRSIPPLDRAAAHSVQRWTFKPALDGDKPVAVWVAVPVEFSPDRR